VSDRPPRIWPFAVLTVLVVLSAAGTGLFFGALATVPYTIGLRLTRDERPWTEDERRFVDRVVRAGPLAGASTGAATGLAWSLIMVRRARRRPRVPLTGRGTLLGLGAGALSAAAVHAVLLALDINVSFERLATAFGYVLLFGLPSGAAVGAICGGLCVAVRRLAERPESPEPAPVDGPGAPGGEP
jgi:MFS family permease